MPSAYAMHMGRYIRRVPYILGGLAKAYISCFKRLSIGSNHRELPVVRTFTDPRLFRCLTVSSGREECDWWLLRQLNSICLTIGGYDNRAAGVCAIDRGTNLCQSSDSLLVRMALPGIFTSHVDGNFWASDAQEVFRGRRP